MEPISETSSTSSLNLLLKDPAPAQCKSEILNFAKCGLPQYNDCFAMQIHDILTPEECTHLLRAAEATTKGEWEQAMVNVGGGRQMLSLDTRNCGRIIWDERVLAQRLLDRIMPHLPNDIITLENRPKINGPGPTKRKEVWKISRLNERLRFLKYTPGMYFKPHRDGCYVTPNGEEVSFLTVHLYLNNAEQEEVEGSKFEASKIAERKDLENEPSLQGGATRFFSSYMDKAFDVLPVKGMCLVFQHRHLIHSGEDVIKGVKYTVRTDVMYQKVEVDSPKR